jgi:hypothetical protein
MSHVTVASGPRYLKGRGEGDETSDLEDGEDHITISIEDNAQRHKKQISVVAEKFKNNYVNSLVQQTDDITYC